MNSQKRKNRSFKCTDEEYSRICELAGSCGLSVSEYIRNAALNRPIADDRILRQSIAAQLCRLSLITENDNVDETIRNQINGWRADTWRLIR